MRLQLHFQHSNLPSLLIQIKNNSSLQQPKLPYGKKKEIHQQKISIVKPIALQVLPKSKKLSRTDISESKSVAQCTKDPACMQSPGKGHTFENGKRSKLLVLGAVAVGVVLFLMGFDDTNKALALGPEGPLMEEFWDNMRRYGIYALTVSTGVLWAVFQPIYELLKNPISAILILTIMGGSFYIVSQVVSAMVGITDFSYDYNY